MDRPSALRSRSSATHDNGPASASSKRQVPGLDPRLDHQLHPRPQAEAVIGHGPAKTFADLPAELREIIWEYALPETRVFSTLVYASKGLKMQLLGRSHLRMPLAHVCFESRQLVQKAGYVLAFRDEDEPDDPGVWFHPHRDVIERTIWGPRDDFWGWK
ncbi:hypothetical protein F5Y11DRAFT_51794 [Daldinia sp. FL1419]|nr:hypothetical protein F5Y11DRAFT_51794 [Daldinia sp. FL1419]